MKFTSARLPGVFHISLQPQEDHRGYLLRTYCEDTFAAHGLNTCWKQCNQTLTHELGAVRGMHWQTEPHAEIKLVRCLSGRVWDVVVDIRRDSPTFGQWEAFELCAENPSALYIPAGYAHGFQCLLPSSILFYMMSAPYMPEYARGLRWDDPLVAIPWPLPASGISARDMEQPQLSDLK
ncbi:dTDP-4-dehydrorhamnose 3,5-epimerase family protein [Prosthecobacter sp. SYSU 5D2]|uniref:dTDP-4-dehydrorhamnose 3,5-epimerase family protein n=1 Tax=Prosthecobacter sp. SYSU 5D2 TaxID=3134134 RepID=UPI0031FED063